jgi:phage repressor protein C with HTH and peptisase S24 domain
MSFADKLKAIRAKRKLTQQQVADAMGVSKVTVSDWENGKQQPRMERLPLLADALGVAQRDLLADEMEPLTPEPRWSTEEEVAPYSTLQPILAWEHPEDLPEGEFVMVPRLAVKLSAGNGQEQVEIEFTKAVPQAFRAQWIREQHLKPNKLAAMTADGDSMETTIFDGDSLLVDTSQTDVVDGKVYALWYDGGERVKRLFRLPGGGLRIKSDNPEHAAIEVSASSMEHVRILGRVVHRSGKGGL